LKQADDITGRWLTAKKDAVIEIYNCGALKYCGKIIWTRDDEENKKLGRPPDRDEHNPNPVLRDRPIIGLEIMRDFVFRGGIWENGRIYDTDTGKTYKAKVELPRPDKLVLRGYVFIPLFGGSTAWTRVK
jgi:uncharacterized protein (DUF2147 family)